MKARKILIIMCCLVLCLSFVACGGKNTSVESYISSIQDEIDQMTSQLKDSGMDMKVLARENTLVYSYQYNVDIADTTAAKDSLEQAMSSLSSTFEGVLSSLKKAVPSAESVVVEYLDKNGEVIYSKEFK